MRTIKLLALIIVSSFLFACGDDGGFFFQAVGNKTFIANGGDADSTYTGSYGGFGGGIYMDVYGDVKVSKTGTVNTKFTIPSYDYHFGSNKVTISADTTVVLDPVAQPAAGVLYVLTDDENLYISDGTTGIVASGLEVQSGATLTLPANYDGGTWAYVWFDQSVVIDGTVKADTEGVGIDIECASLLQIGSKGLITTKPATAGANAGDIYLYTESVCINKGVLDASGADNSAGDGGNAGYAWIDADGQLYNTGTLLSIGGNGSDNGGYGSGIGLYSYYASVYTSGVLDTSGGNGANGYGGIAGYYWDIDLQGGAGDDGETIGHLVVGGTLTANGGSGTNGNGGYGGDIYMETNGGKLWTSAAITAKGGASTGSGDYGGDGGWVYVYGDYGNFSTMFPSYTVENWGIKITGNIDLSSGGGSAFGGYAGTLYVYNNITGADVPPCPAVQMVGYKSLSMNGGSGYYGGYGGGVGYYGGFVIVTHDWWTNWGVSLPVGSITNNVPASLRGGTGSSAEGAYGGFGGFVEFWTDIQYGHDGAVVVKNSAALDVSAGDGYHGAYAGTVLMYGYNKTSNSGVITGLGGDGAYGGYGPGWTYYGIYLLSSYDVENTGAIKGSGGFGTLYGGYGGYVGMFAGNQVKNKASITVNGGDSDGYGGYGGWISIFSALVPTSNTGSLKVKGGAGVTADGIDGYIYIDGVDVGPVH